MMRLIRSLVFSALLVVQAFSSLVASYDFSGNTLDGSGNGHDAALHGATYTLDRFGADNSALAFDGVDDFVNVPHFALNGPMSVSGWFYYTGDIWPHHIALLGQATSYDERWTLGGSNQELFWYDRRGSDNHPYNILLDVPDRAWHHLVAVASEGAAPGLKVGMYLDGAFLGNVSSRGFQDIGNDYQIGSFWTEWGWEYSKGIIDDIRIYDHVLTAGEVQGLYTATAVPEPATLAFFLMGLAVIGWRVRRDP
jgi:hypothetical protein